MTSALVYAHLQTALDHQLTAPEDATEHDAALAALTAALPQASLTLQDAHTVVRIAYSDQDRAALDEGLRQYVLQLLLRACEADAPLLHFKLPGTPLGAPPALPRLLALACWMCEAALVTPDGAAAGKLLDLVSYCRLFEECLEASTIADSTRLFGMMEQGRLLELLAREAATSNAAKLCVLRSCNGLLKRLSKAQDMQLCGRILIFITRIYPLADKSGINLHGTINSGLPLHVDEVAADEVDGSGEPVDAKLYATFWGLQAAFKNPASVLQLSMWAKTAADIGTVLDALEARKVTVKAGPTYSVGSAAGAPTVKYLASPKLFGLQMRDATCRRQFLVQCLVLLHHLGLPSKSDRLPQEATHEGLGELRDRVLAALRATDDNGDEFAAAAASVVDYETQWVEWKNAGCPPFERPPASPMTQADVDSAVGAAAALEGSDDPPAKRRRVTHSESDSECPNSPDTLQQLLNVPEDQWVGLAADDRRMGDGPMLPTFQEFVQPVLEEMDPEACIEPEYRQVRSDRVFAWKVMRAVSRAQLDMLDGIKGLQNELAIEIERAVLEGFPHVKAAYEAAEVEAARRAEAEAAEAAAAGVAEAVAETEMTEPGGEEAEGDAAAMDESAALANGGADPEPEAA